MSIYSQYKPTSNTRESVSSATPIRCAESVVAEMSRHRNSVAETPSPASLTGIPMSPKVIIIRRRIIRAIIIRGSQSLLVQVIIFFLIMLQSCCSCIVQNCFFQNIFFLPNSTSRLFYSNLQPYQQLSDDSHQRNELLLVCCLHALTTPVKKWYEQFSIRYRILAKPTKMYILL